MSTTRRKFACGAAAFAAAGGLSAAEGAAAVEGTLFNVWKFATKDGPGIRTVFALKGCPLRCVWCHSPESWSYAIEKYSNGETVGWKTTAEKVVEEALRDKPFYDASGGGLTLTGGEPLAQAAFCTEILRLAKAAGLHTAVETSGYAPAEVVEGLERFVDLWLYDVKLLDPEKCLRHTGRPLAPVLENLRHLNAAKRRIVMRCPMIPGINDDDAELKMRGELADGLDAVEAIDVLPYVPYGIDKAHRLGLKVYEAPQPPPEYGRAVVARLSGLTGKTVRLP
ncbi:MAG: radical SAM protein [Kiritimatiellae bacterium]|nr:radical SAM protein [Kiritimatiellia bacterium]